MPNRIGYATTAAEAQALRETAKCIVLLEVSSDQSVLKSIAQSLRTQDVFIGDTNNPTIRPYIPILQSAGVVVQPQDMGQAYVKGTGIQTEDDGTALPEFIAKAAKREARKVPKPVGPKLGRPQAEYIDDKEIVRMRDERGMSFQQIADALTKKHNTQVYKGQVHAAYQRATKKR